MFYIGLYREQHEKIFLSETTRIRALVFGMWYHLADLYQSCPNYSPGAKMAPPRGSQAFIGKNMKKSSCLKPQGLEP